MGQVPETGNISYLIVGNGRLANHIRHYFKSLNVSYSKWHRNSSKSFAKKAKRCSKILLAINDSSIEEFIRQNETGDKTWIHFSGALKTDLACSVHPLMTFSDKLYELDFYKSIPFITIKGKPTFKELFPELPNPSYQIEYSQKTFYHAWCSVAGNFTSILWSEFFKTLENSLGIDKSAAYPYLQKIKENLITAKEPLTGPLARGDASTIQKHMLALERDAISNVYQSFIEYYKTRSKSKK